MTRPKDRRFIFHGEDDSFDGDGMKARMLLFSMILSSAPHAQNPSPGEGVPAFRPDMPTEAAFEYAHAHETTLEEAERRLRLQAELGGQVSAFKNEFKDTFAGMYLDNGPDFRIVVRLKGPAAPRHRFIELPSGQLKVVFQGGATATRAELLQALDDNKEALRRLVPGIQGSGIDDRTGEIVIRIHAPPRAEAGLDSERRAVQGLLGVPVRIEVEETMEENLQGPIERARCRARTEQRTTEGTACSAPAYNMPTDS